MAEGDAARSDVWGQDGWAEAGLKRRNHGCQEVEGQTGVGSACGVEGGRGQSGGDPGCGWKDG